MNLNLIMALFWLVLAVACILYSLVSPHGGWVQFFSNRIHVLWMAGIAIFMFGFRLLRWWLIRVQARDREVMSRISGRARRRVEERNPDFDFSQDGDKDK